MHRPEAIACNSRRHCDPRTQYLIVFFRVSVCCTLTYKTTIQTPRRNARSTTCLLRARVVVSQLTQQSQVLPKTTCMVLLCIADVRLNHQLPIPIRYHGFLFSPEEPLLQTTSQPNALISVLLLACMIPLSYARHEQHLACQVLRAPALLICSAFIPRR